jgi:hypothetical protein
MSITSQALKIGAILLLISGVSQLVPNPAQAGCFSDYCSNKRAAEATKNSILGNGGSPTQAGMAAWERRWGSAVPGYYNPNSYRGGAATTNQSANCQKLAQGYYSATNQMAKNIVAQVYQQQCSN